MKHDAEELGRMAQHFEKMNDDERSIVPVWAWAILGVAGIAMLYHAWVF